MGRRRNGSGTLYRRGATYYAQIKVAGRTLRLSTGETNKRRATARLDAMARGYDLSDDERLAAVEAALRPHEDDVPIEAAFDRYMAGPRRPQTETKAHNRRTAWMRFYRWAKGGYRNADGKLLPPALPRLRTLDEVDEQTAAQFMSEMRGRYAPQTLTLTVSELSQLWRGLRIGRNPWKEIPPERGGCVPRRAFTDDELRRVLGSAEGELRTLLMVGAYTGLRISDAATLRWESVSPDMATIALTPGKTAHSSGMAVTIPVHPALRACLGRHGGAGYVMPAMAAKTPSGRCDAVQRHLRRCGIATNERRGGYRFRVAVYGFHSLRATFVTRLANLGMPLAQIQGMVGHVSPRMTMHYYRADAEAARGALERLPALG